MRKLTFKKRAGRLALCLAAAAMLALAGCSASGGETESAQETESIQETEAPETKEETTQDAETTGTAAGENAQEEDVTIRVGALKGPTSMGLVELMQKAENGETEETYEFTMATAADEINASFIKGDLDIVLIPANVASVLYNKMDGDAVVIDINTLGVLYVLESGDTIESVADLAGRTVYLPGKGTTPDYALQYVLSANGLSAEEVDLQYKSEAAEVISALAENPDAAGLLPQPSVTTALMQNEDLRIALDLTEEWDAVSTDSSLVTGVTVVSRDFLYEHPLAVESFLAEHASSTAWVNENAAEAAELVADLGIVPQAAIAEAAIPYCNITCLSGEEMKTALSGYLAVLYAQSEESVGGALPGDDFYHIPVTGK